MEKLGYDSPIWLDLLKDGNNSIKTAAARAVGKRVQYYEPLLVDLIRDSDINVSHVAGMAFGNICHYDPRLIGLLKDSDENVRESAAHVLIKINYCDPQLENLLKDENPGVRKIAACILLATGHMSPLSLLKDNRPEVKIEAAGYVQEYNPALLELLKDNDPKVRLAGIGAMERLKQYDPLCDLIEDNDLDVACKAIYALEMSSYYEPKLAERMIGVFKNKKRQVTVNFLESLSEAILPSQVVYTEPAEGDTPSDKGYFYRDDIGIAIIFYIGTNRHYDPILIESLFDENSLVDRNVVVDALIKCGHFDPKLVELLRHDNSKIRGAAAQILGQIGHYDDGLWELINDEDLDCACPAAYALGHLGHYDPRLVELLSDRGDRAGATAMGLKEMIRANREIGLQIFNDIKRIHGLIMEGEIGELIGDIHEILKPQGYIAPERLTT